jgi:hypothetical protein
MKIEDTIDTPQRQIQDIPLDEDDDVRLERVKEGS